MKRIVDLLVSVCCLTLLFVPLFIVSIMVFFSSKGPVLHWSHRVGKDRITFSMPKFRTMKIDTPQVPTELLPNPKSHLTSVGSFLRVTSIDELPQLYSVLKGDMSLVGPRPLLPTQHEIIEKRDSLGIYDLKPGITGWAQINGRDYLSDTEKVHFDYAYLQNRSLIFDLQILIRTVIYVVKTKNVSH